MIYNLPSDRTRLEPYENVKQGDVLVGTADLLFGREDGSFIIADWKTGLD
jgi:hypothetical protein